MSISGYPAQLFVMNEIDEDIWQHKTSFRRFVIFVHEAPELNSPLIIGVFYIDAFSSGISGIIHIVITWKAVIV